MTNPETRSGNASIYTGALDITDKREAGGATS
jgi:hypothetical protein